MRVSGETRMKFLFFVLFIWSVCVRFRRTVSVNEIEITDVDGKETSIVVEPLGGRRYKIAQKTIVVVRSDQANFKITFDEGYVTDFRSGGLLVDFFIDQVGYSKHTQATFLCHDAFYTPCKRILNERGPAQKSLHNPVSRKLADELLEGMLIYSGIRKRLASIVYDSVSLFGSSPYNNDDEYTEQNKKLFSFEWLD